MKMKSSKQRLSNPLESACRGGHLDVIKYLISEGFDVNSRSLLTSPFSNAILSGKIEVVKYLVSIGVNIHTRDLYGRLECLISSCVHGNDEMFDYFGSLGQKLTSKDDLLPYFLAASGGGNLKLLKHLLDLNSFFGHELPFETMRSMLEHSCAEGHIETSKFLVFLGCQIQPGSFFMDACHSGNVELVKFLDEIQDIEKQNASLLDLPFADAMSANNLEMVQHLISIGCDSSLQRTFEKLSSEEEGIESQNSLMLDCNLKNVTEVLKYLISIGSDSNLQRIFEKISFSKQGKFSLDFLNCFISMGCHVNFDDVFSNFLNGIEITKYLVSIGGNFRKPDRLGRTPIQIAAIQGDLESVEYLKSIGCILDVKTDFLVKSKFFKECETSDLRIISSLISLGLDINSKNEDGDSGLTVHCKWTFDFNTDFVKYFLDRMKNNRENEEEQFKSFWFCCRDGKLELIKFFIEYGKVKSEKDKLHPSFGMNALQIATQHNGYQTVEWLISIGCDIYLENRNGIAPTEIACRSGNFQLIKLFLSIDSGKPSSRVLASLNRGIINHNSKFLFDLLCELRNGVDKDTNLKTTTPLHLYLLENLLEIVKFLIRMNFDRNARDSEGRTVFFLACELGNVEALSFLLKNDVNQTITNNLNQTPMEIARQNGHFEIVALLEQQTIPVDDSRKRKRGKE